jgi:hypothetical protein
MIHITNLASQNLIMEIMQNAFIHNLYVYTLILCIVNTFETHIFIKMQNSCDIHSFISFYFIHQHIYLCVKHVLNTWYFCVKCTNLWMTKLCIIFIINSLHVKFVMYLLNDVWMLGGWAKTNASLFFTFNSYI